MDTVEANNTAIRYSMVEAVNKAGGACDMLKFCAHMCTQNVDGSPPETAVTSGRVCVSWIAKRLEMGVTGNDDAEGTARNDSGACCVLFLGEQAHESGRGFEICWSFLMLYIGDGDVDDTGPYIKVLHQGGRHVGHVEGRFTGRGPFGG